ncbi:hypothetical protein [Dubosiella muris]|nr:hypothetical protein [Dubosiella muris]
MKKRNWMWIAGAILMCTLSACQEPENEDQKMYSLDEYQEKFDHSKKDD